MLTCSRTWYNFIRIPLCPISLASPPWAKSSSSSNHLLIVQAITIHVFAEHFIYHILKLNPVSSITRNAVRYSMTFFSCLQATISIRPTGDLGFKVWVIFLSGTFFHPKWSPAEEPETEWRAHLPSVDDWSSSWSNAPMSLPCSSSLTPTSALSMTSSCRHWLSTCWSVASSASASASASTNCWMMALGRRWRFCRDSASMNASRLSPLK